MSFEVVLSTCEVGIGARCAVNCKLSLSLCSLVEFQLSSWLHVVSSVAAEEMSNFVEVLSSSFVLTSRSPGCVSDVVVQISTEF